MNLSSLRDLILPGFWGSGLDRLFTVAISDIDRCVYLQALSAADPRVLLITESEVEAAGEPRALGKIIADRIEWAVAKYLPRDRMAA